MSVAEFDARAETMTWIGVGNVEPDVRVGWRFDDYRRGVDTVLARALETP